jgi:beta-glucosidase
MPPLKTSHWILLFATAVAINACNSKAATDKSPWLNTSLSIPERVDLLVARMTLEEKIAQMMHQAPAIPRLGIPEYNWWSEGLHGVARAGLATVFPQAIGLGATWDEDMLYRVSSVIADEARAKHHEFVRKNKRFLYQGLTLWSPNINIFRDPRWGRGQETYGEDPFLTGSLAVQFIKGLQGDDSVYLKTIATVKHLAVHSGPEPERHVFDARSNQQDLADTYLPQFEMGIKEGKAYSVMCAYNRLNGEACCGSNGLLNGLLRKDWQFNGYIVSDCEAITDIYAHHKLVSTPEEAAAISVKSGTDLECGKVFTSLKTAVEKKLITEQEIDVAVKRLFIARFKLGMFDETNKFATIPYNIVDSKPHRELALEAAHKSIVLLKNENNILPLKKNTGTIAVIGPNADQWLMLLGNYNGVPADAVTPLRGIREKVAAGTNVLFAQGSELAEGMPMFYTIPGNALFNDKGEHGLKTEFFNNKEFTGQPVFTGSDSTVDVNWRDQSPREGLDDDNFGVRWSGVLQPTQSGIYQLGFISTCNTKLYLGDSVVAKTVYHFRDEYGDPRLRKSVAIKLEAGKKYTIKLEAAESYADAQVQLVWAAPKPELKEQALHIARQADVVVLCMGLTARMEGEEMDVAINGFRGGDRTAIDLPQVQQQLIREIKALGKPVVLVLLNGSALAVNWENDNIPAIVEAWYPGQAAGQALADVLFGDYNPAGRLPVTFYKSVKDLPPFEDYNMKGRTYKYFSGEALYPFGYGLSYTSFQYDELKANNEIKIGESMPLSVTVKNTGKMAGDEVVQVYLSSKNGVPGTPLRTLAGYKRIHMQPGESKTVNIMVRPDAFATFTAAGKREILPGNFEISVGGGQPGMRIKISSGILQTSVTIMK